MTTGTPGGGIYITNVPQCNLTLFHTADVYYCTAHSLVSTPAASSAARKGAPIVVGAATDDRRAALSASLIALPWWGCRWRRWVF